MTARLPDGRRVSGAIDSDLAYVAERAGERVDRCQREYDHRVDVARTYGGDPDDRLEPDVTRAAWRAVADAAARLIAAQTHAAQRRREAGIDDTPVIDPHAAVADLTDSEHDAHDHYTRLAMMADRRWAISDAVDDLPTPVVVMMTETLTGYAGTAITRLLEPIPNGADYPLAEIPAPLDSGPVPPPTVRYYVVRRTR